MTRREYSGAAITTRLSVQVDSTALVLQIASSQGWPAGGALPFFIVVDRGSATEEKMLVAQRTGTTLTIAARGQDGTVGLAHNVDAVVEHVWTATDADESNAHVNSTGSAHGTGSPLVGESDTQTLTGKTIDAADNTILGLTSAMIPGLDAEQDAQDAATNLVQSNLNAEASTRGSADTALGGRIDSSNAAIGAETTNRINADALKFDKSGGTISGAVTMNSSLTVGGVTSVPLPSAVGHAATKGYVDTEINKVVDVLYGTAAPPASGFKQGDVYLRYT